MDEGERGKREGMKRVDDHADEHWKLCFHICLKEVCETMQSFNVDDVSARLREQHPNATTRDRRAQGPAMKRAATEEWAVIVPDDYNKSREAASHKRPKATWYSLIYKGPNARPKPKRRRKIFDPRQLKLSLS